MNRKCYLTWGIFLAGMLLNAVAQQPAPAPAPAPPPLVGTLAAHPDWPAAKNPSDVDTVDHLDHVFIGTRIEDLAAVSSR